jgi:hypothetical protein
VGLCIADEFQDWRNSIPREKWPSYADEELLALISAYNRMEAAVPNHIRHTVNVLEIRKLAKAYVERLKSNSVLYDEFMTGEITLLYLSIDFGNTIACGGTLQTVLEWYK